MHARRRLPDAQCLQNHLTSLQTTGNHHLTSLQTTGNRHSPNPDPVPPPKPCNSCTKPWTRKKARTRPGNAFELRRGGAVTAGKAEPPFLRAESGGAKREWTKRLCYPTPFLTSTSWNQRLTNWNRSFRKSRAGRRWKWKLRILRIIRAPPQWLLRWWTRFRQGLHWIVNCHFLLSFLVFLWR